MADVIAAAGEGLGRITLNRPQALHALTREMCRDMIGALVGGLLQSVTFVVGIKALLLIVATLYLAAVLSRPKAEAPPAVT